MWSRKKSWTSERESDIEDTRFHGLVRRNVAQAKHRKWNDDYHLLPVVLGLELPSEAAEVLLQFRRHSTVMAQLLRNAADIDTGAAPVTFLGDGDPRAVAGGKARAAHAARSAADDKQVIIVVGQLVLLRSGFRDHQA